MSDPAPTFWEMSEEEYLRTEPDSPIKREFFGGYVYPLHGPVVGQAGASSGHGKLTLRIGATLLFRSEGTGCSVYTADMRVNAVNPTGRRVYYYPDVVVTCETMPDEATVCHQPCLLVEVLSPSTGHTDRTDKLWAYTSLPSLQTYLIVDASKRFVRVVGRTAEGWQETELVGEGLVPIPCLNMTLTLDDIYAGVLDR
ncbi:Uma2 family endonuclease [Deinococcus sp. YIM 134068]|uniref:Uma2 family endonuclease n=1 Tax=Deinococcus lichenicola TaxID=3118910 RepID=UPI002F926A5F